MTLTLNQFIKKWNRKYCEITGSANAKNQCTDLANAYLRDVLGLPIIKWTNAKDFPSNQIIKKHFGFIKNTPSGIPKKGDLIVWGGRWGHIAIFLSGNVNSFTSFDQNYPTGSPCHKQKHNYNKVKGWLRSRKENMSECLLTNSSQDKKTFEMLVSKATRADKQDKIIKKIKTLLEKILK